MTNGVRTSQKLASVASRVLSSREDETIEEIAWQLFDRLSRQRKAEEIAKSLAGSVLSNRRA